MHIHPHIHAELARQRQAELMALAKQSRTSRSAARVERTPRLAVLAGALRRLTATTNKETCDAAVRHFAS